MIDFTSPSKKKREEIQKLLAPGDSKTLLTENAIQKQISLVSNLHVNNTNIPRLTTYYCLRIQASIPLNLASSLTNPFGAFPLGVNVRGGASTLAMPTTHRIRRWKRRQLFANP